MTIRELTFDEVDLVSGGQDDEEEVDEIVVVGTRRNVTYYYVSYVGGGGYIVPQEGVVRGSGDGGGRRRPTRTSPILDTGTHTTTFPEGTTFHETLEDAQRGTNPIRHRR